MSDRPGSYEPGFGLLPETPVQQAYRGIEPPAWPVDGEPALLQLSASQTVIRGTQGLDDAQLVVTVQDQAGRALSNSPDVTLTIVSGPGKFPTGRRIAFGNKSLVAIRDGQAAISFRAYDAGQTVIEATSPGLKPARVTITTTGPDKFAPGRTPLAEDLPDVDQQRGDRS